MWGLDFLSAKRARGQKSVLQGAWGEAVVAAYFPYACIASLDATCIRVRAIFGVKSI